MARQVIFEFRKSYDIQFNNLDQINWDDNVMNVDLIGYTKHIEVTLWGYGTPHTTEQRVFDVSDYPNATCIFVEMSRTTGFFYFEVYDRYGNLIDTFHANGSPYPRDKVKDIKMLFYYAYSTDLSILDTYASYFSGISRNPPYYLQITSSHTTNVINPSNLELEYYSPLMYLYSRINCEFTCDAGYSLKNVTPVIKMGNLDISSSAVKTNTSLTIKYMDIGDENHYIIDNNITIEVVPELMPDATITNDLNGVTNSNSATTVQYGGSYQATLSTLSGYYIKSINISMDGTDVTESVYDAETGEIDIPVVEGDIVITATASANPIIYYDLTDCTSSNTATTCEYGDAYTTTITADTGYSLDGARVLITIDGIEQTDVYNNGVISIPHVTGNLNISIIANSIKTFEFRSMDGNTLYLSLELPYIRTIRLMINNNTRTLRVNGVDYTWTQIVPIGKELIGLSLTANAERYVIPVGIELTVNYNESTTFYETIVDERPETHNISFVLYKCSAESNRVDKTNYLQYVTTLEGTLREGCNLTSPSVKIEYNTVVDFNYVYIPIWNRYYFVQEVRYRVTKLIEVFMKEDVLMSHKDALYRQKGLIGRNEFTYDEYLVDAERILKDNPIIEKIEVSSIFNPNAGEGNIILNVIGGNN